MALRQLQQLFGFRESLPKIVIGFIAVAILGGMYFNLTLLDGAFVGNNRIAPPRVYDAADVLITNKSYLVPSSTSEPKDWLHPEFKDDNWLNSPLGKQELRTLPSYESQGGTALHRIRLKIPMALQQLDQPIVFLLPGIFYSKYQVYVNGHIVTEEEGIEFPFFLGMISIAKEDISNNGEVVVAIRGVYKEGNLGISFYSPAMLGVKSDFQDIYVEAERTDNSYFNFILALKVGFLTVFIILFLVTRPQRFMAFFLAFAILNTLATAFIILRLGEVLSINVRAFGMFNMQLLGYAALWFFVESLYETRIKFQRWVLLVQLGCLNLLLFSFFQGKLGVDLRLIFKFHYIFLTEILFAVTLLAVHHFKTKSHQGVANLSAKLVAFVLSGYFLVHIWLHYLARELNNNSHQPIDILFFIFVGFIAASEFLKNQIKVIELGKTLDGQKNEVELGKSAARIAHDIRKPFSNMKIALAALQQNKVDSKTIESFISEITDTIDYGEDLARQILSAKQTDIVQMKPCSPAVILEKFRGMEKDNLARLGIDLEIRNLSSRSILGDETMIVSVITNIVNNAVEAFSADTQKKIQIITEDYRDSIGYWNCRLSIKNNGPKIPAIVLEKLFKDSITYGKERGTGLGLTGVKAMCERMNAEITVYNLPTDFGVAFEIKFHVAPVLLINERPAQVNAEEVPVQMAPWKLEMPQSIERIAVVDDDELIKMAWKIAWPDEGLIFFETPDQLFTEIERDPGFLGQVDLLITDQYFGSKSTTTGIDLCLRLQALNYHRIILASGSEPTNELVKVGFFKVIDKQILTKAQLSKMFIN